MNTSTSVLLTTLLTEEHKLIQRGVVLLARLCAHTRQGGELDLGAGEALLTFIKDYADAHHHAKEEDILFPWMQAQGFPQGAGPIGVMLSEHRMARELVSSMDADIDRLRARSDDAQALSSFREHAESYATLLWQHIFKEDNILYPMAERLAAGTAGLYDPGPDDQRRAAATEAEFRASIERMEAAATSWPREDVEWPQGCH